MLRLKTITRSPGDRAKTTEEAMDKGKHISIKKKVSLPNELYLTVFVHIFGRCFLEGLQKPAAMNSW